MKLKMDKSYPPKIMGQLPFPFSQTKELDESVPIAWRTTDTLMPSATQVHEDNSNQPSPTTVRALNWLYALGAATKHHQQHALVDHARSRAMLWHRLYRPRIKIIWGMNCHVATLDEAKPAVLLANKPMEQKLPQHYKLSCFGWGLHAGACTPKAGPCRAVIFGSIFQESTA